LKLRNVKFLESVASSAEATIGIANAGFSVSVIIVRVGIPGPEDVVIAAFAARGYRLVKCGCEWLVYRIDDGKQLTKEASGKAAKQVLEDLTPKKDRLIR
jgi:hypothetical protein